MSYFYKRTKGADYYFIENIIRIDKKDRCFFIYPLLFRDNVILFNGKSVCFYNWLSNSKAPLPRRAKTLLNRINAYAYA